MPIVVQHQPVGVTGLAAYATGFGKAKERRQQEALKYMTEQQRMQMDAAMQLQRQKFMAGEAEKDRLSRDFIPIGPGGGGGVPAVGVPDGKGGWTFEGPDPRMLPAPPVVPRGPEGVPELPGITGSPLLPPTGPVGPEGVPEPPGTVGASSPPSAVPSAPTAPTESRFAPPGSAPTAWELQQLGIPPGSTHMPRRMWDNLEWDRKENLRQQRIDSREWDKDAEQRGRETPKSLTPGTPAYKDYANKQNALRALLGKDHDRSIPATREKIQELIDEMDDIERRNAERTPAERVADSAAYADKDGVVYNEPAPGRKPGYVGPDGQFIERPTVKDPVEDARQKKEEAFQQDIMKNQRDIDSKRMLTEESRIRADKDITDETVREKKIQDNRKLYDDKWGLKGTAYAAPAEPVTDGGAPMEPPAAGAAPAGDAELVNMSRVDVFNSLTPERADLVEDAQARLFPGKTWRELTSEQKLSVLGGAPERAAAPADPTATPTVVNPPVVNNAEEYARIPSGTIFIDRDGQTRRKR